MRTRPIQSDGKLAKLEKKFDGDRRWFSHAAGGKLCALSMRRRRKSTLKFKFKIRFSGPHLATNHTRFWEGKQSKWKPIGKAAGWKNSSGPVMGVHTLSDKWRGGVLLFLWNKIWNSLQSDACDWSECSLRCTHPSHKKWLPSLSRVNKRCLVPRLTAATVSSLKSFSSHTAKFHVEDTAGMRRVSVQASEISLGEVLLRMYQN